MTASSHPLRQVFSPQVVVPHQPSRVLVPRDLGEFMQWKNLSQARSRLVSQVMEAQIGKVPRNGLQALSLHS